MNKWLTKQFKHLQDVHMDYWTHWKHATTMGTQLILNGSKLLVHAFVPCLFEEDATKSIAQILEEHNTIVNKHKKLIKKSE